MAPRKCRKKKGIDRISCMPDNILHRILSFLPADEAVATCLLSSKWKELWIGISNLKLLADRPFIENSKVEEEEKFISFVENLISRRDGVPLGVFVLFSQFAQIVLTAFYVNKWISYALLHKVRMIVLNLIVEDVIFLPYNVLDCELVILKVQTLYYPSSVRLIASVCFAKLKHLHLENITIFLDQMTEDVSFTCPSLVIFVLRYCRWENVKSAIFHAPKLERLEIISYSKLPLDENACQIKFYVESLTYLDLTSDLSYKVSMYSCFSLQKAYIKINGSRYANINSRVSNIMETIRNISELELTDRSVVSLKEAGVLRKLQELTKLRIITVTTCTNFNAACLESLLYYLPGIEYLSLLINKDCRRSFCDQFWTLDTIPQPSLGNLKSVELQSGRGDEVELSLVKYLLKSGNALEKITLTSVHATMRKQFMRRMRSLFKGSGVTLDFF